MGPFSSLDPLKPQVCHTASSGSTMATLMGCGGSPLLLLLLRLVLSGFSTRACISHNQCCATAPSECCFVLDPLTRILHPTSSISTDDYSHFDFIPSKHMLLVMTRRAMMMKGDDDGSCRMNEEWSAWFQVYNSVPSWNGNGGYPFDASSYGLYPRTGYEMLNQLPYLDSSPSQYTQSPLGGTYPVNYLTPAPVVKSEVEASPENSEISLDASHFRAFYDPSKDPMTSMYSNPLSYSSLESMGLTQPMPQSHVTS